METQAAIASKVRDYIARNFLFSDDGFHYEDDDSFLELGVVDSFGIVELLGFVESEFGISVSADELVPDNFDSIAKVSAFVAGKQGSGA